MKKPILVISLIISTFLLTAIFAFITIRFIDNKSHERKKEENVTIAEIKNYDYYLNYNDNDVYKKYFYQLNKELTSNNVNYDNYAELISKLFIIDFFTLSNKKSNTDIGGIEFIYEGSKSNFILNAKSTIYAIIGRSNGYDLPTVNDVNVVKINSVNKEYDGKLNENAYDVYLNWQYKKASYYQNTAVITVVKENNKLYIVEMRSYE